MLIFAYSGCRDQRSSSGVDNEQSQQNNGNSNCKTIKIKDGNGNPIKIRKPVKRIIVEYTDNAELVRILGRADRIVGVAGYDYVFQKCKRQFPEIRKKPSVGYPWALDYEAVLKLNPELLFTFTGDNASKRAKLPGVNVVFLGLYKPDLLNPEQSSFIKGVRNAGKMLDAQARAAQYIRWYTDLIKRIESKTSKIEEKKKPKVLVSSFPQCNSAASGYCAYSKNDTLTQASIIAGGDNLVETLPEPANETPSIPVDVEWLIKHNPDIIILHAVDAVDLYGYEADNISGLRKAMKRYLKRPELQHINAVKNKRVYIFDGHFRNDSSGGVLAAAYMARLFHPQQFKDLDPEAVHQKYLEMQHLEYSLDRHGIFVYPPLKSDNDLMGIPEQYRKEFH
ncbi:MAG: ABC transporter substrate-binding protein [Thermodesulfobacteriota bacterium]